MDDPDKDSGGKIEVSLNISLPNLHCDCEYIHIYKYLFLCITSSVSVFFSSTLCKASFNSLFSPLSDSCLLCALSFNLSY